ncbi:MAG TPA: MBL fold metallo-hydrolase [Planctomycetota bacterium]|nr:MBL fold metallo-hydrolase [Planctomycetota bacterium]
MIAKQRSSAVARSPEDAAETRRRRRAGAAFALASTCAALALASSGCAARGPAAEAPQSPYVLVLGTAQDGGLPQIGCDEPACRAAREDPRNRRHVASLLLVDPRTRRRWLIDATPDLAEQVELARDHPPGRGAQAGRPPLFEGIFLTHAHVGHYAGLARFGREAYAAERQRVFASQRMADFLESNGPWDLLISQEHIVLDPLVPGREVELAPDLRVFPIEVPHRGERSDTLGFVVRGPERSLLYIPDIDKWERWDRRIEDLFAQVDVALLDGTFFADGEIAGRSMAEIPHPFIRESIERFRRLPEGERRKILFTHLNHTNPAADERGAAAAEVRAAGMDVARDGMVIPLGTFSP